MLKLYMYIYTILDIYPTVLILQNICIYIYIYILYNTFSLIRKVVFLFKYSMVQLGRMEHYRSLMESGMQLENTRPTNYRHK